MLSWKSIAIAAALASGTVTASGAVSAAPLPAGAATAGLTESAPFVQNVQYYYGPRRGYYRRGFYGPRPGWRRPRLRAAARLPNHRATPFGPRRVCFRRF